MGDASGARDIRCETLHEKLDRLLHLMEAVEVQVTWIEDKLVLLLGIYNTFHEAQVGEVVGRTPSSDLGNLREGVIEL